MDENIGNFQIDTIVRFSLDHVQEVQVTLIINNNKVNFKRLNTNKRSISKNTNEFNVMLDKLKIELECLIHTETWEIHNKQLFGFNGYNIVYNERT